MLHQLRSRRKTLAFTLVELLVVIAIIALLASLIMPNYKTMILRARGVKCGGNLRAIGIAASLAATDNNNAYPEIDQAATPVYTPPGQNLVTALGPYGITTNVIQCPVDMSQNPSSFAQYQSSYEWNPVFDDEVVGESVVYPTPTNPIKINSSRVRLATDFTAIHNGRQNAVYGDGHVAVH